MAEIGRRIVHASGVVIPAAFMIGLVSWNQLQWLLLLGLTITVVLETVRLRVGLDWWIYEHLTRPYEADSIAGYALYMVSITIVAVAFDPTIAIPAMLMLMLGDPISGYLGGGEVRPVKRPIAVIAMFLISALLAIPFAATVIDEIVWAGVAAVIGAVGATTADAVTISIRSYIVDDNLTIPIVAAGGLWLAYQYLPPIG